MVGKKSSGIKKAKGKGKNAVPNFSINLQRVFKDVAPACSITQQTMQMANALAHDLFDRLFETGEIVRKYDDKGTLSAKHIQVATKAIFRSELSKHAVTEGTKAVSKFQAYEK